MPQELSTSLGGLTGEEVSSRLWDIMGGLVKEEPQYFERLVNKLRIVGDLRRIVGEKLYNALTPLQQELLINTAGIVDLGEEINIKRVYDFLEEDYNAPTSSTR